jgi:DNA mismatch endonuclease, patch repair protein
MDKISKEIRSRNMAAIRDKDTKPELAVRRCLHSLGYRFRLHKRDLPGKPDLFLRKYNSAIFIHGCFWHQHKGCKYAAVPKSNVPFWAEKLKRNVQRDKQNISALKMKGYRVKVVWECETRDIQSLTDILKDFLKYYAKQ